MRSPTRPCPVVKAAGFLSGRWENSCHLTRLWHAETTHHSQGPDGGGGSLPTSSLLTLLSLLRTSRSTHTDCRLYGAERRTPTPLLRRTLEENHAFFTANHMPRHSSFPPALYSNDAMEDQLHRLLGADFVLLIRRAYSLPRPRNDALWKVPLRQECAAQAREGIHICIYNIAPRDEYARPLDAAARRDRPPRPARRALRLY